MATTANGLYEPLHPLQAMSWYCSDQPSTLAFRFRAQPIWSISHAVVVFAFDDGARFRGAAVCIPRSVGTKIQLNSETRSEVYARQTAFETFPFPKLPASSNQLLATLGETYHEHRRQIMLARQEGLTATYNRFHNPDERAADIARLRELHVEMDRAVAAAYGWSDLDLGHGFHETAQGVRFTISEAARREVLGRLLELNHQRYAEEVAAGVHEKGKAKVKAEAKEEVKSPSPKRRKTAKDDGGALPLF